MDSGLPIGELPHSLCWLCVVHSLYCSASIVLGCTLVLMYMYRSSVAWWALYSEANLFYSHVIITASPKISFNLFCRPRSFAYFIIIIIVLYSGQFSWVKFYCMRSGKSRLRFWFRRGQLDHENNEYFTPRKLPAIQYCTYKIVLSIQKMYISGMP